MFSANERVGTVINRKHFYGTVFAINDSDVDVMLTNGDHAGEVMSFAYEYLHPQSGFVSETDVLQAFCRYEITSEEVKKHMDTNNRIQLYQFSIVDFYYALMNFEVTGVSFPKLVESWFDPMSKEMSKLVGFDKVESRDKSIPTFETWLINKVWKKLDNLLHTDKLNYTFHDLQEELHIGRWSPASYEDLLIRHGYTHKDDYQHYADLLTRLCRTGNPEALSMRGTQALEDHEWDLARDSFQQLYDQTGVPEYAEKLGMIYSIGEFGPNGEPDYRAAHIYYSIAADAGLAQGYLGKAELAAMGAGGYVRNTQLAGSLVREAYDITIRRVLGGYYDNLFPEAAMRFGDLIKEDHDRLADVMRYYLQAKGTLLKRNSINCTEDDMQLLNEIDRRINDIESQLDDQNMENVSVSLEIVLSPMGENNGAYTLKAEKATDGEYFLTFSRAEDQPLRAIKYQEFLLTPDVKNQECFFLKNLVVKTVNSDGENDELLNKAITFDDCYFDTFDDEYVLFFYGTKVAKIKGLLQLELAKCDFYEEC